MFRWSGWATNYKPCRRRRRCPWLQSTVYELAPRSPPQCPGGEFEAQSICKTLVKHKMEKGELWELNSKWEVHLHILVFIIGQPAHIGFYYWPTAHIGQVWRQIHKWRDNLTCTYWAGRRSCLDNAVSRVNCNLQQNCFQIVTFIAGDM